MAFLKQAHNNKVEGKADEWGDGAMHAHCPVALVKSGEVEASRFRHLQA